MITLLSILTSCSTAEEPMSTPSMPDPAAWEFTSSDERTRYEAIRADLSTRFDGGVHLPPERLGNFLRERWCPAGTDPKACGRGRTDFVGVSVLHTPPTYPQVFGLIVEGRTSGAEATVELHMSLQGRTITGDSLKLTVHSPGEAELVGTPRYRVGDNDVAAAAADPLTTLQRLVASPESLAQTAVELDSATATAVRAHLDSGKAERCVYGEPPGGGRPPPCSPTPLTAEEIAAEHSRLEAWLGGRAQVWAQAGPIHAALTQLVPAPLRP